MNEILQNLLVLAVLGGMGAAIFIYINRRGRARKQASLEQIRQLGWTAAPVRAGNTSGMKYTGTEGQVSWEMEATRTITPAGSHTGSDDSGAELTRWRSGTGALDEGLMLLGYSLGSKPVPAQFQALKGAVVQKALQWMAGEDAGVIPNLREVALPHEIRNAFMAFSDHPFQMQEILTGEVITLLEDWPPKYPLVIKFNPSGVELTIFSCQVEEIEVLQKIVRLGLAVVRARDH